MNLLVVGAPDTGPVSDSGRVFVYRRGGAHLRTHAWVLVQKLEPAQLDADDAFGASLDMSQGTLVVGAAGDDDAGPDAGAAYVYEWTGLKFLLTAKLIGSDAAPYDLFGSSVAVDGDDLCASAPFDDDKGEFSGSVYRFAKVNNVWVEKQKLTALDGAWFGAFGLDIDLEDERLVSRAWFPGDAPGSGVAYLFAPAISGSWEQKARITPRDASDDGSRAPRTRAPRARFGRSSRNGAA